MSGSAFYRPLPAQQLPPVAVVGAALDRHLESSARTFAEMHPLQAARALAAGINGQTKGAKLSVIGALVAEILRGDRTLADRIAQELRFVIKDY